MNTTDTHYRSKPAVPQKILGSLLVSTLLFCCKTMAAEQVTATGPAVPAKGISASAGIENTAVTDADVLAHIGDVEVSISDVKATLRQLDPVKEYEIEQNPVLFQQIIESVALRKLLLKEALSKHWDKQPKVDSEIERLKATTITNSYLLELTKLPDDYPSEDELRKSYEASKQALTIPHNFQLAQIFIPLKLSADKEVTDEAEAKLETVLRKLKEPNADFGNIARSESADKASATKGGEMGWVEDSKIPPLIRVRVIHLPKNGIADPVRIDDGWHIVKVLDSKDVSPVAYEKVKTTLAQQLRAQKLQGDIQTYLATLLKQNPVSIDQDVFSKILSTKNQ